MGFGFLRINTTHNKQKRTYKKLIEIDEVREVYDFGNELFAKVYADNQHHLNRTITEKIQKINGVLHLKGYLTKDLQY
jgi:DNA-binding Lrp family transcriptional regulator